MGDLCFWIEEHNMYKVYHNWEGTEVMITYVDILWNPLPSMIRQPNDAPIHIAKERRYGGESVHGSETEGERERKT